MRFTHYKEREAKQYSAHLAFSVGIPFNIAYAIANDEQVFTALAQAQITQKEKDYDIAVDQLRKVKGIGRIRAELYLEKYFENPYQAINWKMFEILKKYQEQLGWKDKTIYDLARRIDEPEKVWDAHLDDPLTINLNIAIDIYRVTTKDDQQLQEEKIQYFTQHRIMKQEESDFNRLTSPAFLFNEEINEQYGLFLRVANHIILRRTAEAYQTVLKFFRENKERVLKFELNEDIDTSDFASDQEFAFGKLAEKKTILLTGFAGTGKTYMLDKFISNAYFNEAYICSLAGKAVKNFYDSLSDRSKNKINKSTIAGLRYVGKYLESFRRSKLCIVDECSMISMHDLAFLINNLDEDAKLILIGDINQLPAIELDVLNWLVEDQEIEKVVLDIPKRQTVDSGIFEDSMKIIAKETPYFDSEDSQVNYGQISIQQIIMENEDADIFLTTTHKIKDTINGIMSRQIRLSDDGHQIFDNEAYNKPIEFHEGEKIMIGANNPDTGLMNGDIFMIDTMGRLVDQGTGEWAKDLDGNYIIVGENRFNKELSFSSDKVLDISAHKVQFAFAITTHKSQGSTLKKGATIIAPGPLAINNLLYTALTRFKEYHKLYLPNEELLQTILNTGVKFQKLNELQQNVILSALDKEGEEDE